MIRSSAPSSSGAIVTSRRVPLAAGHEVVKLGDRRWAQRRDELGTRSRTGDPGAFEVRAEHDGPEAFLARMSGALLAAGHGGDDGDAFHRRPQRLGAIRDGGRDQSRRAVPGVKTRHAPNRHLDLLAGGAVHLGAATAVDVQVDEAGRDQHVAQVHRGG